MGDKVPLLVGNVLYSVYLHCAAVRDDHCRIYREMPLHLKWEHSLTMHMMNQPTFLRAVDTQGKDIVIPYYIDPLGYEFWGEE